MSRLPTKIHPESPYADIMSYQNGRFRDLAKDVVEEVKKQWKVKIRKIDKPLYNF